MNMKKYFIVSLLLIISYFAFAQNNYSRVKIILNEKTTMQRLHELGIEVDHGSYQKDKWFISDLSNSDIEVLREYNIPHEIQIADVTKYYIERNNQSEPAGNSTLRSGSCKPAPPEFKTPNGFNYGSMGGFFTYDEAIRKIDSLAILYPNIVTSKNPIGTYKTTEGREIFWLKISDNPNKKEDEPEILFDALHHAREPLSLSQLIYFMYYICENYSTNPEIKNLVDQIEMYFVPIVNPDGYVFNFTTNPNGGGMWRKNRRINSNTSFGVDINRNYGKGWGYNNSGSSNNINSDVYRGPSAFSEPEIQAMRDFCNDHQFKFAMNYHTYSNLLVYPWGYLSKNCNDSLSFREISKNLSKFNKFKYGTDLETVGYSTNGSSDDWMYGDSTTKPMIFSFTPEVGTIEDGFWPTINRIIPLCNESIYMNLTICKYLLKYATIENLTPRLTNDINGHIYFNINKLGLANPSNYTVSLVPINGNVASVGGSKSYASLNYAIPVKDSISFSLNSNIPNNTEVKFALKVQDGEFSKTDTISLIYGKIVNLLNEDCSSFKSWNNSGWAIDTTLGYSNKNSFGENQFGNYPNNYFASLSSLQPLDLSNALHAELTFKGIWQLENNYDYVNFQISEDNGLTWQSICTPHNQITDNQLLDNTEVYTGVESNWVTEIINLDSYVGKKIYLLWDFSSDNGLNMMGFNMDDIVVNKLIAFNVGTTDINENLLVISPNPASKTIHLKHIPPQKGGFEIKIYNNLGEKLLEKTQKNNFTADEYTIDIQSFKSGIYFLEFISGEHNFTQKIIIEQ